jgi:Na+:H+ antiporter, NhaA family
VLPAAARLASLAHGHPPAPGRAPLRLPAPLREYLREEAAGGIVLMAAAALALVWANSPWQAAYAGLWETRLAVQLGRFTLEGDLRHWVNDGLMTLFFLVVGLEIKRELVSGELRTWRSASLPVVAAAGGMAVPAGIYALLNAGGPGADGWGCRWRPTSPSPSACSPCSARGCRRP